jgi:hypothetical protein
MEASDQGEELTMAPKKAAKKSAKDHGKKDHHEGKDLRRAYEHLGRLSGLEKLLSAGVTAQIGVLTELAQRSLLEGEAKSAADLLRAGEHLGFGSLASQAKESRVSEELASALNAEYEHLVDKAEEHWEKREGERPGAIEPVYESMVEAACAAFAKGAWRRALEFARGAEALAHVRGGSGAALLEEPKGKKAKRLRG